jgi:hypothetical protein
MFLFSLSFSSPVLLLFDTSVKVFFCFLFFKLKNDFVPVSLVGESVIETEKKSKPTFEWLKTCILILRAIFGSKVFALKYFVKKN